MNSLLKRALEEGTPLIDRGEATFIWRGETAPMLVGDFNDWGWADEEDSPARLIAVEPGLWATTLRFHEDAYMEYIFTTDHREDDARLLDPLNKHRVSNGVGSINQYFRMPGNRANPYIRAFRGPRGSITRHLVRDKRLFARGQRRVWLYAPPVDQPVPLLVVYDGQDYMRRGRLPQILDHLIDQQAIRPLALAMVESDAQARFIEYDASEATLAMIMKLVLPLANAHLNLLDVTAQPGAFGVLGASMGGLMSLYTGLRLPHLFGHVISQSAAVEFDGPYPVTPLLHAWLKHQPRVALRIWQDAGRYEWLLEQNRSLNSLLRDAGYTVDYQEFSAGHNYTAWRDMLPQALQSVYGI